MYIICIKWLYSRYIIKLCTNRFKTLKFLRNYKKVYKNVVCTDIDVIIITYNKYNYYIVDI